MKPSRAPEPIRWRDRAADTHALEPRAAVLADAARQVQPLPVGALSRIRNEVIARRQHRGVGVAFLALSLRARLAVAIGVLVLCVTTAGGARILWRKYTDSVRRATPPPAEVAPPRRPSLALHTPPRTYDVETAPSPVPVPVAPPVEPAPLPVLRARPASPAAIEAPLHGPSERLAPPALAEAPAAAPAEAPAPAAQPRAVTEGALLAEALFQLRQRDDPRAALATLDRHAREFPHGVFEVEALRTRVEAVVKLGDMKTALVLLDGNLIRTDALGDDLLLARAELRAAAGRFREALADFTQVMDAPSGSLAAGGDERALYGRAVCLGRLAEPEGARADLLAYQKRFPRGRFAREVKRLLADGP
jgi:hypothetical protein